MRWLDSRTAEVRTDCTTQDNLDSEGNVATGVDRKIAQVELSDSVTVNDRFNYKWLTII